MSFLERQRAPSGGGDPGAVFDGLLDQTQFPELVAAFTALMPEDKGGDNRFSLIMFPQDGVVKMILKDKLRGICLWVASRTIRDALPSLEEALATPGIDWRLDRQAGHAQAKRVKKGR